MTAWLVLLALAAPAQIVPEVRQLVTFKFLPGRSQDAVTIFKEEALPVYRAHAPMLRFRAYREAESPEPLDLIVVSTYQGMEGMDMFHDAVRKSGASLGGLYGRIGALTQEHRDEFVEMDASLAWGGVDKAPLQVLVSHRIAPGKIDAYESVLRHRVIPWEKQAGIITGSESGRFLVSNGWHYFRLIAVASLGDWHRYLTESRAQPWSRQFTGIVAESKQTIVAPLPELSVR